MRIRRHGISHVHSHERSRAKGYDPSAAHKEQDIPLETDAELEDEFLEMDGPAESDSPDEDGRDETPYSSDREVYQPESVDIIVSYHAVVFAVYAHEELGSGLSWRCRALIEASSPSADSASASLFTNFARWLEKEHQHFLQKKTTLSYVDRDFRRCLALQKQALDVLAESGYRPTQDAFSRMVSSAKICWHDQYLPLQALFSTSARIEWCVAAVRHEEIWSRPEQVREFLDARLPTTGRSGRYKILRNVLDQAGLNDDLLFGEVLPMLLHALEDSYVSREQ